ncbi:MAG TPA: D-alanyl-D-alanine carboxypeptidase family protein [Actinomycetes bacterium]|jgi:hypothetical protein|nr:D-alanyl-D-alanine carboxypeptidase family protein [Actinomycetes bacterium]
MAPRRYRNEADLQFAKLAWAARIGLMHRDRVVRWLVGLDEPSAAALTEVVEQRDALFDDLCAARRAGASLNLPESPPAPHYADPAWLLPPIRSYADQLRIWNRKFTFTGPPFDRISKHARQVCGPLLRPQDEQWQPDLPAHRQCWGVAPWASDIRAGRPLTIEERQREILTASAAPGLSRHHWGTDADLFTTEVAPWLDPDRLLGVHAWLAGGDSGRTRPHAARYGFIQPFTADSGGYGPPFSTRRGHMAEPWHWSYFPIAQALLEFALAPENFIEAKLHALWQGEQFSFVRRYWRDYLFNVNSTASF